LEQIVQFSSLAETRHVLTCTCVSKHGEQTERPDSSGEYVSSGQKLRPAHPQQKSEVSFPRAKAKLSIRCGAVACGLALFIQFLKKIIWSWWQVCMQSKLSLSVWLQNSTQLSSLFTENVISYFQCGSKSC